MTSIQPTLRQTPPPQMPAQKPSADVYTDDVMKCALRYVDKNYIPIPSDDGSIGQFADPTQMYQEFVRKEAKRVARRIERYLENYRYRVGYAMNRLRQGTMDLSSLLVYISDAVKPLIDLDAEFLIAIVNKETNFDQEIRNTLTTHTLDPNSPAYGVDPEVYIAESIRNSKRNSKVKLPEITPLMSELARDQTYGIKPSVNQAFILQKKNTELERLALELASRISPDGSTMSPPTKEEAEPTQPPALPSGFIIPRRKFKP